MNLQCGARAAGYLRLAFGLLVIGVAASPLVVALAGQSVPSEALIAGAVQWVPFKANFRITNAGVVMHGTYARGADGSERRQTTSASAGSTVTDILNIAKRVRLSRIVYESSPGSRQWEMRPLVLPRAGYEPQKTMSERSRVLRGGHPVQIGALTVWETSGKAPDGTDARLFVAPDLNFFIVKADSAGWTQDYFDIVVGDPEPALFELPPDAEIAQTGTPIRLGRFTRQELGALR